MIFFSSSPFWSSPQGRNWCHLSVSIQYVLPVWLRRWNCFGLKKRKSTGWDVSGWYRMIFIPSFHFLIHNQQFYVYFFSVLFPIEYWLWWAQQPFLLYCFYWHSPVHSFKHNYSTFLLILWCSEMKLYEQIECKVWINIIGTLICSVVVITFQNKRSFLPHWSHRHIEWFKWLLRFVLWTLFMPYPLHPECPYSVSQYSNFAVFHFSADVLPVLWSLPVHLLHQIRAICSS